MKVLEKWKSAAGTLSLLLVIAGVSQTGCSSSSSGDSPAAPTQFIYTSDPQFGVSRTNYPTVGTTTSDAHAVNAAMVAKMNVLPALSLPCGDNGVNACKLVGAIDFVVNTGDIANRMEAGVQSAAASWLQFESDYINGLTVRNKSNAAAPVFLVPGNHDVSNAIGYYKTMSPLKDATTMAQMFNRMLSPSTPRTADTYNYATDKVYYSRDIGGVHFLFINMWPDSTARSWMEADLAKVPVTVPVVIFTHDEPPSESKHFTNPNGTNNINSTDKFENLLADKFADATTINDATGSPVPTAIEQRALVTFLKAHKNIVAYFHGNDNYNQSYVFTGPDNDVSLNTFRVDSPMKGSVSGSDPSKLSFLVVSIDGSAQTMTVREFLWNATAWGSTTTVSLAPRSK